jgi:hypothetical protein
VTHRSEVIEGKKPHPMTRLRAGGAATLVLLLSLAAVEAVLRLLATSGAGAPHLFGRPLPPIDPLAGVRLEPTRYGEPVGIGGEAAGLTRGDLWGISQHHPSLGHAPVESGVSVNGWWQTNSHGARSRHETPPEQTPGATRWMAFGDSFTHGSRVRQEQTWPALVEAERPELEVVNFGVDGYGMAQSLLRYREKRDVIDHSGIVLVFVPGADLVRDVNVFRPLLGWSAPITAPRFELESRCDEETSVPEPLRLVPPLYPSVAAFASSNARGMSHELREHLRCHDALYHRLRHERLPVVGRLYLLRLVSAVVDSWRDQRFRNELMKPGSEALRVSRAIFREISGDVRRRGRRFLLVFLPLDREVARSRDDAQFRRRWRSMLEFACPGEPACLDLLPGLAGLAPRELDRGLGSHYGPRANRAIARLIAGAIGGRRPPRHPSERRAAVSEQDR